MHILLTVSYDGTNYSGWQRQENSVTVQQKLEEALFALFKETITLRGASRTDAGVHAIGQRAKITVETKIPTDKIPQVLNRYLPKDISVTEAIEVDADFHPQYDAVRKTYEYKILNDNAANPIIRNYTEHIRNPLDIDKMNEAAAYFVGTHDFKAFCSTGGNAKTTMRTIYSMSVSKDGNIITIAVTGNGFLYNMVRIISGTIVSVGGGKLAPDAVRDIIFSRDRSRAGKTLSPRGLTLVSVEY